MMSNNSVIIIGGGNIGRRHLQAALKADVKPDIYIYDKNAKAFEEIDKLLKEEHTESGRVRYLDSLNSVPPRTDVAIIATDSRNRKNAFFELVGNVEIKYCILEKVLFTKISEYEDVSDWLKKRTGIKAFVNCARRYTHGYNEIRRKLAGKAFTFTLEGSKWGLGCNAIHFLDLISFLGGVNGITIDTSLLDDEIIDSKRMSYKEVTGRLIGNMGGCSFFNIECGKTGNREIRIIINSENKTIFISEAKDQYLEMISGEKGIVCKNHKLEGLMTSVSTTHVLNDLFSNGDCLLPEFAESCIIHRAFINALQPVFAKQGFFDECPIT